MRIDGRFIAGLTPLLTFASGCLMPPEGEAVVTTTGPVADLNQIVIRPLQRALRVAAGELDVDPNGEPIGTCRSLEFDVRELLDRNSSRLLFRWVADNWTSDPAVVPAIIAEGSQRRDESNPEDPFSFRLVLVPAEEYSQQVKVAAFSQSRSQQLGTLSLFVTDADSWSFDDGDDEELPPNNDFSAVPDVGATVVEVGWSLQFERGQDPACEGAVDQ